MKRKQFSLLITGVKGCGKTQKLMEFVKSFYEDRVKVCFIYNNTGEDKIERFKSIKIEEIYSTTEKIFRCSYHSKINFFERLEKITKPQNGRIQQRLLLVFDDGMYFIRAKDYSLENILRTQRQRNLDLIFVTHQLTEIPASFWGFFNCMLLFKTSDNLQRSAYKIPNKDYLQAQCTLVNSQSESNPYVNTFIKL